jgi:hypothetical protein
MKLNRIFRAGTHTSASGEQVTITTEELQKCCEAYHADHHEAPVVVGHPADNAPAYGWVSSLAMVNGDLVAETKQVDSNFAEMVNAGRFKKISASFYKPDSTVNPVAGVWYLRHVGVLGAVPPAVKGLGNASFSEDDGVVAFEFTEQTTEVTVPDHSEAPEDFTEKIKQLDAQTAEFNERVALFEKREADLNAAMVKLTKDRIAWQVKQRVQEKRIKPELAGDVERFLEALQTVNSVQFSDSEKSLADWFLNYVDVHQPKHDAGVVFSEVAKDAELPKRSPQMMAQEISAYAEKNNVPFHVAAKALEV